jgi:DNA-binding response OmpR family regulator
MSQPGNRILLVDDDADFALALKLALEADGYVVALAGNGREALDLQRLQPAGVVITDLVMPEQDGFEIIQNFRREFPQTKIVVVSGAEKLDVPRYLSAAKLIGVDATLQKPFAVATLLKTLRALQAGSSA